MLMQHNFDKLHYVLGDASTVGKMPGVPALPPFSSSAVDFLHALSKKLQSNGCKAFSDVATFAFWCRKAALVREKALCPDAEQRLGLGVAFHSTPSNVAVNFAYSFAAGLLAGNANIVRLPGRKFAQVACICQALAEVLEDQQEMKPYISMVNYSSSKEISDYFSSICDVRVVWGGDATIAKMRLSPLSPRAREICFADRYSILLLNSDAVLQTSSIESLAKNFYNDTYFSDQNACTAPSLVVWVGNDKGKAKERFWAAVQRFKLQYSLEPAQAVGKLRAFYNVSAVKKVRLLPAADNFVTRLAVEQLDDNLLTFKENSGFFFEYDAQEIEDILPVCTAKCQTLTYFGFDKSRLGESIRRAAPRGVDRIVPVGKSMEFSLMWDGIDLIRTMSRLIYES